MYGISSGFELIFLLAMSFLLYYNEFCHNRKKIINEVYSKMYWMPEYAFHMSDEINSKNFHARKLFFCHIGILYFS